MTRFKKMGLAMVQVLNENEMRLEQGLDGKVPHDKDPSVLYVRYPSQHNTGIFIDEHPEGSRNNSTASLPDKICVAS